MGITIENKIAMGMVLIRIITRKKADDLVDDLKSKGYSLTNVDAEGNSGNVKIIFTVVKRKNINYIVNTIKKFNPNAFYTIENIGFVSKNFIPINSKELQRKLSPQT